MDSVDLGNVRIKRGGAVVEFCSRAAPEEDEGEVVVRYPGTIAAAGDFLYTAWAIDGFPCVAFALPEC